MSSGVGLLAIYIAGVVVGLVRVDGPLLTKVGVALVWPLGLLAFAITVAMLLCVAAVAFPVFGVVLAVFVVTAWLLM